ncbi:MAG: hypothetical protein WD939_09270, partial [Dehalococcoidia bacterium]
MTNSDTPLPGLRIEPGVDAMKVIAPSEQLRPEEAPPADSEDQLNLRTAIYVSLVVLGAAICVAFFARGMEWSGWAGFVTLIVVGVFFERVGITIYGETHVSAGGVALFAAAVIFGAPGAAIAAPIVVAAATMFTRSRWYHRLFDMSTHTLITVSAALVFHALVDVDASLTGWWVAATLPAIAAMYLVNIMLVDTVVGLSTGESAVDVWREQSQWFFAYYIMFGLLGLALAAGYFALGVPGILVFVAPPLMMRVAFQQYV